MRRVTGDEQGSVESVALQPVSVRPGARVGVAALSGVVNPARLAKGIAALREMGFEPVEGSNLDSREYGMAGSDQQRLHAFHELLADDSLSAIWFARGGYGLTRVLPHIDFELLAATPRLFIGYSDLTPLLLEIERRTGWMSLHGPMVAAELADGLDDEEREVLLAALGGDSFPPLPGRISSGQLPIGGVVRGGCLSMLAAAIGTPYAPNLSSILFLEDHSEPRYRLDRMLTQLQHAGLLEPVRAIAVGCAPTEDELWAGLLEERGLPYVVGLPAGHLRPNHVIPLGAQAQLGSDKLEFTL